MNRQEMDILALLRDEPFVSQRILSETAGYSLGAVNKALRGLMAEGYLDSAARPTRQALDEFKARAPRRAIILAAGFGMRMAPINTETPKALLEIGGETLIERQIRQLHEAGITEICIVVGFLKERFEYLIDEYGVELLVNEEYAAKNNLHSLALAEDRLENTYIIPCDVWCARNPFRRTELYSWYMVTDLVDDASDVRVNRKLELVSIPEASGGNAMIGIAYLTGGQAAAVRERLQRMAALKRYDGCFWEETLYEKDRMIVQARVVPSADVAEINTYEQLREIDEDANRLQPDALAVIEDTLHVRENEIIGTEILKKGTTNRSFRFTCRGRKYIMRIPGERLRPLIDRQHEASVYAAIAGRGLCDDPLYVGAQNGYRLTRYIENARTARADSEYDLRACMAKLRAFHEMNIRVDHSFDIFGMIEFYESLWDGKPSVYRDYDTTRENIFSLRAFIEAHAAPACLTHIDAVPDNFLFVPDGKGGEDVQLIDWEYAGMQDPHVDIAMFCLYARYDRARTDRLIDLYFEGRCEPAVRIKIYCYIAACGLVWSNWCEYERGLGVEFGAYSLHQYRCAKEFYRLAAGMIETPKEET